MPNKARSKKKQGAPVTRESSAPALDTVARSTDQILLTQEALDAVKAAAIALRHEVLSTPGQKQDAYRREVDAISRGEPAGPLSKELNDLTQQQARLEKQLAALKDAQALAKARAQLGMRIRLLRGASGLTLDDAAKSAGVGRMTWIRYEKGNVSKFSEAQKMIQALGRSLPSDASPEVLKAYADAERAALQWSGFLSEPSAHHEYLVNHMRGTASRLGIHLPKIQHQAPRTWCYRPRSLMAQRCSPSTLAEGLASPRPSPAKKWRPAHSLM